MVTVIKLSANDLIVLHIQIQSHLPEDIIAYGYVRSTKAFNSKNHCSSRHYAYVCPTFMFSGEENPPTSYRITEERKALLKDLLNVYVGTKKYHNFTNGRGSMDESSNRYIMSFDIDEVMVVDGIEFVRLVVHGGMESLFLANPNVYLMPLYCFQQAS